MVNIEEILEKVNSDIKNPRFKIFDKKEVGLGIEPRTEVKYELHDSDYYLGTFSQVIIFHNDYSFVCAINKKKIN